MSLTKKVIVVMFSLGILFGCNLDAKEQAEFYKKEAETQRVKAEQMASIAAEERVRAEKLAADAVQAQIKAHEQVKLATKALEDCKNGN